MEGEPRRDHHGAIDFAFYRERAHLLREESMRRLLRTKAIRAWLRRRAKIVITAAASAAR